MTTYSELAFPLTNSQGLGKLIRFDYKVTDAIDLPLVVSPHVDTMGSPFYTRQILYFLDDVQCVIRRLVPNDETDAGQDPVVRFEDLRRAANDCLFEYSLRHPESRLTVSPGPQSPLIHLFERQYSLYDDGQEYLRADHGAVELLSPTSHERFEEEYQQFLAQIYPNGIFDREKSPWEGTPPALDCMLEEPAVRFHKLPYTYEELELLSHIIPANPDVFPLMQDGPVENHRTGLGREWHIGLFMQPYHNRIRAFHPLKLLDQEIVNVDRTYNQLLLSIYFAGLGSTSPIVEFSNYYRVLEYFFEDASYENARNELDSKLQKLMTAEDYREYQDYVKALSLAKDESDQIREVINRYIDRERLRIYLREDITEETRKHFSTYASSVKGFSIQRLKAENAGICDAVADRIYRFRNAIFHSKRTRSGSPPASFRPNSNEEHQIIRHEAQLVKVVAQEIIKKATPAV